MLGGNTEVSLCDFTLRRTEVDITRLTVQYDMEGTVSDVSMRKIAV
jgi:hypothetical protein